ncbi:kinesin-like protein KIF23 [Diaphorina citri]|uniref:Kinesin-like protein KIF23 n=1 Tax=Diaphorina citri TaxID=121845 RepID=A0A3Q0IRL5_DIACI|nr:kinesin-like protein KIF23 [Diaphorina citri]
MSTKPGKTPRRVNFQKSSDPLQVFCRIRPLQNAYEESCISVLSSTTIQLTPPDGSNPRYFNNKEVQYVFKKIFDTDSDQKQIYMEVAHPLVDNLIHGKNGLLLTYGVTGSGKTYTMNGSPTDGGIMTRCIDVLFNSILAYQPPRHTFKPDKMNGFEILSSDEIKQVRGVKTLGVKKNVECRVKDEEKIEQVDEDNVYSVFVSYVEIYNNSVYDLLEEIPEGGTGDKSKSTPLNNRLIREDSCQNMYVHGANEIEVTTAEEALQVLYKGQARKKMARTLCNKESSRSHSVFMIRLVQVRLLY